MSPLAIACWATLAGATSALLWPLGTDHQRLVPPHPSEHPIGGLHQTPARTARSRAAPGGAALPGSDLTASDLADSLVLVALALRSGLGLVDALDEVAQCADGDVRAALSAVVAALRWGRPAGEAWAFAGPAWTPVARAMQLAEDTGTAPADLVADAARRLREVQERELEARAAHAGVLLVLPLGLAFLPAFAFTAVVPVVVALAGSLMHA